MDKIIAAIAAKIGVPDIADRLAANLSGSDLSSLLLEVFNRSLEDMSPAELLRQYRANRFVQPAETDMIGLLKFELRTLEFLRDQHFQPIELSPAAQLGSCSVVAPADQKKIISATRNTEIMADATNSIALHIASLKKNPAPTPSSAPTSNPSPTPSSAPSSTPPLSVAQPDGLLRFCTVHRHVRTPTITVRGHTPHFKIGCLVTSGRDVGNYSFECVSLEEHLKAMTTLFRQVYGITDIRIRLQQREGYEHAGLLLEKLAVHLEHTLHISVLREPSPPVNNYYKGIQYKMIIRAGESDLEISDGGFVDWTQRLLDNRKERLLISGFGLGLLYMLKNQER